MSKPTSQSSVSPVEIRKYIRKEFQEVPDLVVTEEPMEIRIGYGVEGNRLQKNLSVTMRTPGHDFDLAIGFLFTEGIIHSADDVHSVNYCQNVTQPEAAWNIVKVELNPSFHFDGGLLDRHFYTTSSCGVCGKSSLEAVHSICPHPDISPTLKISPELIYAIAEKISEQQKIFSHTGGLHAAALFSRAGELLVLREDVGRHNAVDKIIGGMLMKNLLPLSEHILFLSGRPGFELIQKAAMAGIPVIAAVGAPTSLSVALARQHNQLLIGFLRDGRFNVYSGEGILS